MALVTNNVVAIAGSAIIRDATPKDHHIALDERAQRISVSDAAFKVKGEDALHAASSKQLIFNEFFERLSGYLRP